MRIIYVHQYFHTPEEGGGVRSYHFAKGMVDAGFEVEMITAHNKSYDEYKVIEGVKVHYLAVPYDNSYGFIRRINAFYHFVNKAKKQIKKLPPPQVFYITSTPLSTGVIGLWAKKKLGIPYIFEVRDLWPEAPIQVGAVRNKWVQKLLYDLEAKIYREAQKLVALSPGIKSYMQTVSPDSEIFLVPNFSDNDFFSPVGRENRPGSRGGFQERFTISYTGALGKINALEEFLYLAREAKNQSKDWQFILMGKGAKEKKLKFLCEKLCLKNVKFINHGNNIQVREVLARSDMAYISFDHYPVLKTNSPNKFFDALAMGLGIVINQKGWIYEVVAKHRIGIFHDPKDPKKTIQQLDILARDPGYLDITKKRAREVAVEYFSKDLAVKNILFVLNPGQYQPQPTDGAYIPTA